VAGTGLTGGSGDGGPATSATIFGPIALALDSGGSLYIADSTNNRIRKITAGVISTIAGVTVQSCCGLGDGGPATSARISGPRGVAVDAQGNVLIADTAQHRIRQVAANGTITTIAGNGIYNYSGDGGPAKSAQIGSPSGIAFDSQGNLFVADTANGIVRKISASGTVTTFAGDGLFQDGGDGGPATSAHFINPTGIAVDSQGNVFIGDQNAYRVRKVALDGTITTVAGTGKGGYSGDGGPGPSAQINTPGGLAVDSSGNLYISDNGNHRIRKVSTTWHHHNVCRYREQSG